MQCRGLRSANPQITTRRSRVHQRGYMLITLMLALALISIALLAVLPDIKQQIRRDREEEMRHRGTAYMRAIQHFYKKFGRYPMSMEELENTNNLRFLRKRYKDPMNVDRATGQEKDFKFLHQQDITINSGLSLGPMPGQAGAGGQTGLQGAQNQQLQAGITALAGQMGGAPSISQNPATTDSGDASDSADNPNASGAPSNSSASSSANPNSSPGFNGPTFGGGPILGVASASKAKSIRVFNDKNHYNDWLFVYVPQGDRGGLLVGPVSTNGPANGNFGGGMVPGQTGGLAGQGQNSMTNGPTQSTPTPPAQNSGQTPPE